MIILGRSSSHTRAIRDIVGSIRRPGRVIAIETSGIVVDIKPTNHTVHAMNKRQRHHRTSTGSNIDMQVKYLHSDIKVPNWGNYRRDSTKGLGKGNPENEDSRKCFIYFMTATAGILGTYGAKSTITHYISFMAASADVMALAKIEVDLSSIPEGKNMVFKWRGKPLFIRNRTEAEIAIERSVAVASLRDPQTDESRVKQAKWLVLIGVCTHLGCIPIAGAGDYGGYYCPCHGSHFDCSGRIRKGPAPKNLEVPPYIFSEENKVLIG